MPVERDSGLPYFIIQVDLYCQATDGEINDRYYVCDREVYTKMRNYPGEALEWLEAQMAPQLQIIKKLRPKEDWDFTFQVTAPIDTFKNLKEHLAVLRQSYGFRVDLCLTEFSK
jgi:hypothetical protein